jgi:hypothetical protein
MVGPAPQSTTGCKTLNLNGPAHIQRRTTCSATARKPDLVSLQNAKRALTDDRRCYHEINLLRGNIRLKDRMISPRRIKLVKLICRLV